MFSVLLSLAMAGETVPAPAENAVDEEKKIVCKSVRTLGTRIPERVCRTQKQWSDLNRAQKNELRNRSNQSRGTQSSN